MASRPARLAAATFMAALGTLVLGACGRADEPVASVRTPTGQGDGHAVGSADGDTRSPDDATMPKEWVDYETTGSNNHAAQEWLDALVRAATIAMDRSSYDPLGVLEAEPSSAVLLGEVAGEPTVRVDDRPLPDDPTDPEVRKELERGSTTFVDLVVPVRTEEGTRELVIELGVQFDPESNTKLLRDHAPAPGTSIAAVGQVRDSAVVSAAGVGVAVEEADGTAAIAYEGPIFSEDRQRFVWPGDTGSFDQLADRLVASR